MGNEIHLSLRGALLCDYKMTASAFHKGNSSQKDQHTGSAGQLQMQRPEQVHGGRGVPAGL